MGIFDFFKKKKDDSRESDYKEKILEDSINSLQSKSNDKSGAPEVDEFTQHMINESNECAEHFKKRYGNKFDFSEESLEIIDKLLEDVSDFKEEMNDDQIQWIIEKVGAYIFEVARIHYGGKYFWYDARKQPILVSGLPDFEISLLSFDKVKGRIENGYEDNIPFFFKGYSERMKAGKAGDKAMIV